MGQSSRRWDQPEPIHREVEAELRRAVGALRLFELCERLPRRSVADLHVAVERLVDLGLAKPVGRHCWVYTPPVSVPGAGQRRLRRPGGRGRRGLRVATVPMLQIPTGALDARIQSAALRRFRGEGAEEAHSKRSASRRSPTPKPPPKATRPPPEPEPPSPAPARRRPSKLELWLPGAVEVVLRHPEGIDARGVALALAGLTEHLAHYVLGYACQAGLVDTVRHGRYRGYFPPGAADELDPEAWMEQMRQMRYQRKLARDKAFEESMRRPRSRSLPASEPPRPPESDLVIPPMSPPGVDPRPWAPEVSKHDPLVPRVVAVVECHPEGIDTRGVSEALPELSPGVVSTVLRTAWGRGLLDSRKFDMYRAFFVRDQVRHVEPAWVEERRRSRRGGRRKAGARAAKGEGVRREPTPRPPPPVELGPEPAAAGPEPGEALPHREARRRIRSSVLRWVDVHAPDLSRRMRREDLYALADAILEELG